MGFDVGALLANLFIAFFASGSRGHPETFQPWVLQQVQNVWGAFSEEFARLWNNDAEAGNGGLKGGAYVDVSAHTRDHYILSVLKDSLGFAGT
jgi:5-methylthioribose kinase